MLSELLDHLLISRARQLLLFMNLFVIARLLLMLTPCLLLLEIALTEFHSSMVSVCWSINTVSRFTLLLWRLWYTSA